MKKRVRNIRKIILFIYQKYINLILIYLISNNISEPVKKPSIAAGLHDSNLAAKKLGDIATQKLELKTAYYAKKIQVMEEQVSVLKNIGTMLSSFINK